MLSEQLKIEFTSWSSQSPQPPLERGSKTKIELEELFEAYFSCRSNSGAFSGIGGNGNWWSSTENNTNNAWNRNLNYNNSNVNRNNNNKSYGFSVRCVRDLKGNIYF